MVKLIEETLGPPDECEPERFSPPLTDGEIASVLQQCVRQAITEPNLQSARDFYGAPGSRDVVLVNDWRIPWPGGFHVEVDGFHIRFGSADQTDEDADRILGMRLDKLDVRARSDGLMDGNVALTLTNVGGSRNGAVTGGCSAYFVIHRDGDKVVAEFTSALDP